jgi:hypothetical protein
VLVSVLLLNGDELIPSDAGELMKLTIVAENYVPAVADESVLLNAVKTTPSIAGVCSERVIKKLNF